MRASDRAYATLLEQIQSGALAPGTVLGEVEQAARLGVSRTPLREALSRLASDGLVAQQSPRVTVVTDVDVDDIRALFEVRRALEETAARLAAVRGDAGAFAALADEFAASSLRGEEGRDAYYALIARFDAQLDASIGNDYLSSALRTVRTHLVRVRRLGSWPLLVECQKPGEVVALVGGREVVARVVNLLSASQMRTCLRETVEFSQAQAEMIARTRKHPAFFWETLTADLKGFFVAGYGLFEAAKLAKAPR